MAAVLFHSNDSFYKHRILWSGYGVMNGVSLFADSLYSYIAGGHVPYSGAGTQYLSRITLVSGYPCVWVGPTTPMVSVFGGKFAHYLDENGVSLGGAYIEIVASGAVTTSGKLLYNASYPESSAGWMSSSGGPGGDSTIGYFMNDIIGLDYPDNPRILISTRTLANYGGVGNGPGVMVINLPSGAQTDYRYWTSFTAGVPSGIMILDIETHKAVG
jgi:hypothetical protein